VDALKVLAGHSEHKPPSVPVKPAEHLHSDALLPPTAPSVPELAGQDLHEAALVAPVVDRKVFTGQEVHTAGPVVDFHMPTAHFKHVPSTRV